MFSTLTTRGASSTFEALALGADDYVAKAANAGSLDQSLASLRGELVPKIRQFFATDCDGDLSRPAAQAGHAPRRRTRPRGAVPISVCWESVSPPAARRHSAN